MQPSASKNSQKLHYFHIKNEEMKLFYFFIEQCSVKLIRNCQKICDFVVNREYFTLKNSKQIKSIP